MPRALWKGAISFGLVNVPVELHPAAQTNTLDLTWLDKRTMSPVGYKRYNKSTGKEVPKDDIVKGYEYEAGHYVVLGTEDFKRANPVATQTVEILAFVDREEIPPLFFDTPYYLVPGKRGEKAYALLRETMKRANRAAVASVVIATKQHLAAVIAHAGFLVLNTLRYADEIRDTASFDVPSTSIKTAGVSEKEIDMALKLVESMSGAWDPTQYHDTYREDLLARVDEKVKAGETELVPEPAKEAEKRPSAQVVDLVALLQDSLRNKNNGKGKGKGSATRRAASVAKTSSGARTTARKRSVGADEAGGERKTTRERKRA
ncbi:MAG: Ku protein [Casimicrobiaceae bacterium]